MQSGLIATNAKEVDALRQLGEKNYFEFDLGKTKEPQRVGPISVRLRKADQKRNRFTIELWADDKRIEKKDKTLLEPVQFYVQGSRMPYELVVNKLDKDHISRLSVDAEGRGSGVAANRVWFRLAFSGPAKLPECDSKAVGAQWRSRLLCFWSARYWNAQACAEDRYVCRRSIEAPARRQESKPSRARRQAVACSHSIGQGNRLRDRRSSRELPGQPAQATLRRSGRVPATN